MRIELTSSQREVLLELVNEALRDVGPEIHHARTPLYKENLREFRHDLSALRGLLSEISSAQLVGSP